MPTIQDATVVGQAYQTSANARPQYLKNGWVVEVTYNPADGAFYFTVTKDNGITHNALCKVTGGYVYSSQLFSLTSVGNRLYFIYRFNDTIAKSVSFDATTVSNIDLSNTAVTVDSSQTAFNGIHLIKNDAGTELHAVLTSKNSSNTYAFNARYVKGTISQSDSSVLWGLVEQVTSVGGGTYPNFAIDPIIMLDANGIPTIIIAQNGAGYSSGGYNSTNAGITILKRDSSLNTGNSYLDPKWSWKNIYASSSTYTQSSPSAIFVPQSINGLVNGRIWVAWEGMDSTDTATANIRVSYSDDGGVTWSSMQKLTSGNTYAQLYPSITANKKNEIFILWHGFVTNTTTLQVRQIKNSSGSWGSIVNKTTMTSANGNANFPYPSAMFDVNLDFTEPLFIYLNNDSKKVGFYGTWTVTTISVTQGDLGQKSDKSNVLTYSITTDGTMGTITESINGTVIGTKNINSGDSTIVGLTQDQWDAIKYGKYADVTGGKNTLTISMGSDTFTYTFDKRLADTDDILSAVKSVQDANGVYLPAVKSKLASTIRGKGGTVNDTDSLETMASAISGIQANKKANGTITSSSTSSSFTNTANGGVSFPTVTVTGLSFKPSLIKINALTLNYESVYSSTGNTEYNPVVRIYNYGTGSYSTTIYDIKADVGSTIRVSSTGFTLPVSASSTNYSWVAYE